MQQVNEIVFSASARGQQVLAANPTRLYLVFSVPVGATIAICTNAAVAAQTGTKGMALSSTVPAFLSRDNVGIAITYPWYVASNTGTILVYCLEVFDPDDPFIKDDSKDIGDGLLPFARDTHAGIPGVDVPDTLNTLVSQLRAFQHRIRG